MFRCLAWLCPILLFGAVGNRKEEKKKKRKKRKKGGRKKEGNKFVEFIISRGDHEGIFIRKLFRAYSTSCSEFETLSKKSVHVTTKLDGTVTKRIESSQIEAIRNLDLALAFQCESTKRACIRDVGRCNRKLGYANDKVRSPT